MSHMVFSTSNAAFVIMVLRNLQGRMAYAQYATV